MKTLVYKVTNAYWVRNFTPENMACNQPNPFPATKQENEDQTTS